jgi:hypothetical protein
LISILAFSYLSIPSNHRSFIHSRMLHNTVGDLVKSWHLRYFEFNEVKRTLQYFEPNTRVLKGAIPLFAVDDIIATNYPAIGRRFQVCCACVAGILNCCRYSSK